MVKIINILKTLFGRVDLSGIQTQSQSPTLLHISDTPSQFYPELRRIIRAVKPMYIIHTGDLVDNVKLGLYPSAINRYIHEIKPLLKMLNTCEAKHILFTMGNHDSLNHLIENSGRIQIEPGVHLEVYDGFRIAAAHYATSLIDVDADIYLYGHDTSMCSHVEDGHTFLNGIEHMHLIDLVTHEITEIPYPIGTDGLRLNRHRIGL